MSEDKNKKNKNSGWSELYNYVKCEILGYDSNQALSKQIVLRLRGLQSGQYLAKNNIEKTANYSYTTILHAFQFCHDVIKRAIATHSFKNEMHKFNYIAKIVEGSLNDVYIKEKKDNFAKEGIEKKFVEELDILNDNNVDIVNESVDIVNEEVLDSELVTDSEKEKKTYKDYMTAYYDCDDTNNFSKKIEGFW